jgi:hypothetical protein
MTKKRPWNLSSLFWYIARLRKMTPGLSFIISELPIDYCDSKGNNYHNKRKCQPVSGQSGKGFRLRVRSNQNIKKAGSPKTHTL